VVAGDELAPVTAVTSGADVELVQAAMSEEDIPRKRGRVEKEIGEILARGLMDIVLDDEIHPTLRLEAAKMLLDKSEDAERLD
jgi:hypothetical protein